MALSFLYHTSLSLWIGGLFFFMLGLIPTLHAKLDPEDLDRVIKALYPMVHKFNFLMALLTLGSLVAHALVLHYWPLLRLMVILIMAAMTIYNTFIIYPKAQGLKNEYREAAGDTFKPTIKQEFLKTNRQSHLINMAVGMAGLLVLYLSL